MKNFIKKFIITVCTAAVSMLLVTAPISASASDRPGSTVTAGSQVTGVSQGVSGVEAGSQGAPAAQSSTSAVTQDTQKSYLTRFGGFLWFLLSVIVNLIVSCFIGNKFYHMARRSAQGSSEIRALRKDIEEKFAATIKDIDEPAIEVMNRNESYASTDEGIVMPERRGRVELNDEEREIFRRWDSVSTISRPAEPAEPEPEEMEEIQPVEQDTGAKRAYQPTRSMSGIEFEDDEDEEVMREERRVSESRPVRRTAPRVADRRKPAPKKSGLSGAKKKAKGFISNLFPFDEV